MTFNNAGLLSGGKFKPPFGTFSPSINATYRVLTSNIMKVNPSLYDIFTQVRDDVQSVTLSSMTYFYGILNNTFTKFNILSDALFDISGYSFPESSVEIYQNMISDGFFSQGLSTFFLLKDNNEINFIHNQIKNVSGAGKIVSISIPGFEETRFSLKNNTVEDLQGPSVLTYIADSISQLLIMSNNISNSSFTSTAIDIEIALNDGRVIILENTFYNNTLRTEDNSPYVKSSFLSFTTTSASINQTLILSSLIFDSNRYENSRSFSQYGQLSAFISLILANSSIGIYSSKFTNTNISSIGTSMFYIAAETASITGCSFINCQILSGKSILEIQSLSTNLITNTFENISVVASLENIDSAGLISLNSKPYISGSVALNIQNSTFTRCLGAKGNVLSIESSQINLLMDQNTFTDSFSSNGLVSLRTTNCVNCTVNNSKFNVVSPDSASNSFFNLYGIEGQVEFNNISIVIEGNDTFSNIFLQCTESPIITVLISKFSWEEASHRSPLQLVDMDSGSLVCL